jgi:hypothetical protein
MYSIFAMYIYIYIILGKDGAAGDGGEGSCGIGKP